MYHTSATVQIDWVWRLVVLKFFYCGQVEVETVQGQNGRRVDISLLHMIFITLNNPWYM